MSIKMDRNHSGRTTPAEVATVFQRGFHAVRRNRVARGIGDVDEERSRPGPLDRRDRGDGRVGQAMQPCPARSACAKRRFDRVCATRNTDRMFDTEIIRKFRLERRHLLPQT